MFSLNMQAGQGSGNKFVLNHNKGFSPKGRMDVSQFK